MRALCALDHKWAASPGTSPLALHRRIARLFWVGVAALAVALVLTGCGESDAKAPSRGPATPPAEVDSATADCSEFLSWREAQDALDADPDLEEWLDDDYDGIACNELAQQEYEEAWPAAYVEACEAVFSESPDGTLYLDGTGYEESECEGTDPGPGEWEGDTLSEPAEDGRSEAWMTACDEFFNGYVGGDLYWGDDIVVTQSDCELAS